MPKCKDCFNCKQQYGKVKCGKGVWVTKEGEKREFSQSTFYHNYGGSPIKVKKCREFQEME